MRRVLLAFVLLALACTVRASASTLTDFADAWSKIDNYSCSIVVHETLGTQVQNRTYDYWFKKPDLAHIEITAGPGRGSGSWWHGGDTVVGHQGGLLRGIHMTISLTDPRAVSLRGDTMNTASFGYILGVYQSGIGTESEADGGTIDGTPTDMIALKITNPSAYKDVTRDVLYLSKATHLPVRRMRYEGDTLVKQEDFTNVKLNPGLKDSDF